MHHRVATYVWHKDILILLEEHTASQTSYFTQDTPPRSVQIDTKQN
ncbi:hypothetical protein SFRURICE_011708 [Spodoptera frugiperda]|nr:hypothetical protein SFRURICE_011708 [Spodoptera frugiperda]